MNKGISFLRITGSALASFSLGIACFCADLKKGEESLSPPPAKSDAAAQALKPEEIANAENEIASYSKKIEKSPKEVLLYALRAGVYASIGKDSEAIADFTAALNLGPDPKIASAIYNDRASILEKAQNIEMALKDYENAIKLDPENDFAFFNHGLLSSGQGELPEAIGYFSLALTLNPLNFEAFRNRAFVRYKLEDVEGAISDALEAIRLQPAESKCYLTYGRILLQERNFSLAIETLTKAVALNPSQPAALLSRATAYLRSGNLDGLREDVNAVLKFTPESHQAANLLADYYFLIGKFPEALAGYRKLVLARPPSTQATYNQIEAYLLSMRLDEVLPNSKVFLKSVAEKTGWPHAVCRFVCGDMSEEDFLSRAISDQSDRKIKCVAEAYYYVGEIALLRGNPEIAQANFKKCIGYDQIGLIEHHSARAELARLSAAKTTEKGVKHFDTAPK